MEFVPVVMLNKNEIASNKQIAVPNIRKLKELVFEVFII